MTPLTTPCTPEQKSEWHALHDRAQALAGASHEAEREAGSWLAWGLKQGGPENMAYAQTQALEFAEKANALWAEREQVAAAINVHPYDAEVRARRSERKAEA